MGRNLREEVSARARFYSFHFSVRCFVQVNHGIILSWRICNLSRRICNPHHQQSESDCKSDTFITPDYKSGVTRSRDVTLWRLPIRRVRSTFYSFHPPPNALYRLTMVICLSRTALLRLICASRYPRCASSKSM